MNIDPNQLNLLKDFIPKESRENFFNPISKVMGESLAGMLYYVFQKPLKFGIIEKKYLNSLSNMTSKELSKIPIDNRDKKGFPLAFKAIEDSKYSINDDELRKWFSKLIVSSVDNRKNSSLTPYYSTILSNINGDVAKFLLNFSDSYEFIPLCKIQKKFDSGSITLKDNIVYWNWTNNDTPLIKSIDPSIIDVLISFNIINVSYDSSLSSDKAKEAYEKFRDSNIYSRQVSYNAFKYHNVNLSDVDVDDVENMPFNDEINIQKGILCLTKFGKSFIQVAMPSNDKNIHFEI